VLLNALALWLVASGRTSGTGAALRKRPALTPVQARLAAFGARLEATDRDAADRLFAFACQASGLHAGWPNSPAGACAALLDETRVRCEFHLGQTQSIDGWMLARSEAAACVFLHRVSSAAQPA
jgi:hypothetical protein